MKNEEIYNIFDTEKILNRPVLVAVSKTSGLAGIAHWIKTYYKIPKNRWDNKKSPLIHEVKKLVDGEYESGRVTVITDHELVEMIAKSCEKLNLPLPGTGHFLDDIESQGLLD